MKDLPKVLIGSVPVITVLVAAAFLTPATMPYLARQAILFTWGVFGIVIAERLFFRTAAAEMRAALGLKGSTWRSAAVAAIVSIPMWLFPLVYGAVTGTPIAIADNWPAIVLGVFMLNGIAEETIHRAFIFGHLRRDSSFLFAATVSAVIFAAQHIYLIFTAGTAVGMVAILLAIGLAFPLAFLFERGGNSLVAPAILHTSSNSPAMIFSSADGTTTLVILHMLVVLLSMYASFAFWGGLTLGAPWPRSST